MRIRDFILCRGGFFLLASLMFGVHSPANAQACGSEALVDVTLPTGGRWEMCWEARDLEGVALSDVHYTTPAGLRRRVLKEAALAQLYVALDDGSERVGYVTEGGLGDANLKTLVAADCLSGNLRSDTSGRLVLCEQVTPRGFAYKYYGTQLQGHALSLFSISTVGEHAYVVRWRFFDDGTIEPAVGLAGDLPAVSDDANFGWPLDDQGAIGVGFTNSYYWRLDFDIGADGDNDVVEEISVHPSSDRNTKSLSVTRLTTETSRDIDANTKRSWRIRDGSTVNSQGRAVSYHLEPLHAGHRHTGTADETWARHDFHATLYNACERFISDNPEDGGCGAHIGEFVDGQNIDQRDVVLWYRIDYHHLPRREDDTGMDIRWDSFHIVPRDWTATNPLAAAAARLALRLGERS